MTAARIALHIDRLVLHGFAPGDRHRIAAAIELEFTQLLAQRGVPPSLLREQRVERVNGGTIRIPPGASAEATGTQVARAIYQGLAQ